MKVSTDYPPNFDDIKAAFNPGRGVIYCYGDTIYGPECKHPIAPELHAHEEVHSERQGDDPELWWDFYIADPSFRLAEEIPAHQAEYAHVIASGANRPARRRALQHIAKKLSSPLYGSMITFAKAKRLILEQTK